MSATIIMTVNPDLLRLLEILVESIPNDEGSDGYLVVTHEQIEARKLLKKLKDEASEDDGRN